MARDGQPAQARPHAENDQGPQPAKDDEIEPANDRDHPLATVLSPRRWTLVGGSDTPFLERPDAFAAGFRAFAATLAP